MLFSDSIITSADSTFCFVYTNSFLIFKEFVTFELSTKWYTYDSRTYFPIFDLRLLSSLVSSNINDVVIELIKKGKYGQYNLLLYFIMGYFCKKLSSANFIIVLFDLNFS